MLPIDKATFRSSVEGLARKSGDEVELVGPLFKFLSNWLVRGVLDGRVSRARFASSSGIRSDCSSGQVTVFALASDKGVRVEIGHYGVVAAYVAKDSLPKLLDAVCPQKKEVELFNPAAVAGL